IPYRAGSNSVLSASTPSLACLRDSEMRRRSRSMSMTLTNSSSPTETTCSASSTWRTASSEMWTRPSMPSSTRTNAPNGTSLVTLPGTTWPRAWVRAKVCHGSSCVALSDRETFARTHALGQVVPGKVTKLVPFGAFVRVEDGIEGLVHISELAVRHVELAEQVVSVGDELFVKVIDIDLERRRISLSLKQANEGVDADSTEFDPALYGMAAEYDEEGNYKYPEGFDPESNEWLEGYENQRA